MSFLNSFLLFSVFVFRLSYGSIPSPKMILQRTLELEGSGSYQIELDVQWLSSQDPLVIREIWFVDRDKGLKLTATAPGFRYDSVYREDKKWTSTSESETLLPDWIERPWNLHTVEAFSKWLIDNEIIGNDVHLSSINSPLVRLGRTQGIVNYVFGSKTNQTQPGPGLWIEQDQFHIRKIRWPNQVELNVDEVQTYSKGLSYPKLRTLKWGDQLIQFRTISVQLLNKNKLSNLFLTSNLKTQWLSSDRPLSTEVKQFYSRYR